MSTPVARRIPSPLRAKRGGAAQRRLFTGRHAQSPQEGVSVRVQVRRQELISMKVSDATSAGQLQEPENTYTPPPPDVEEDVVEETGVATQTGTGDPAATVAERDLVYRTLGLHAALQPAALQPHEPEEPEPANNIEPAAFDPASPDLNPRQRAVLSLDLAAAKLDEGDGAGAAQILEDAARNARTDASRLNPATAEARLLTSFAANADARARAYRATAPQQAWVAARDLATASS